MKRFLFTIVVSLSIFAVSITAPINVLAADATTDKYTTTPVDCSPDAQKKREALYISYGIGLYDPCSNSCDSDSSVSAAGKDYEGNPVLDNAQITLINTNQPFYEEAAKEVGIPWQMIAVIHLRESGLGRENPGNGQGIYQDYAKSNGPYPAGPVDDAEFTRQTKWAAAFLKNKASEPAKLATGDEGQVKDAFYGYNGRAGVYETQAKALGFSNGYDGSPYVMNRADSKRDPKVNPTGWGQIKSDGGSIEYPANNGYGAFVIYQALAGSSSAPVCPKAAETSGFVYYSQLDTKWRDKALKSGLPAGEGGSFGADGCGPTSDAMVIASLADKTVTPETVAAYANELGFISGSGANAAENNSYGLEGNSAFRTPLAAKYGLTTDDLNSDIDQIIAYVKAGGLVVMSGNSGAGNDSDATRKGPFSAGGHYVVVKAILDDGTIVVANPYSVNGGAAFTPGAGHPQPWPAEQKFSHADLEAVNITGAYGFKKA